MHTVDTLAVLVVRSPYLDIYTQVEKSVHQMKGDACRDAQCVFFGVAAFAVIDIIIIRGILCIFIFCQNFHALWREAIARERVSIRFVWLHVIIPFITVTKRYTAHSYKLRQVRDTYSYNCS